MRRFQKRAVRPRFSPPADVGERMKFGVPWKVKGVRGDARDTAFEAARRSGMSVGDWLNTVILERAKEQGVYPPENAAHAAGGMPEMADQLTQSINRIDERLDRLMKQNRQPPHGAGPEAYAPKNWAPPSAPAYAPAPAERYVPSQASWKTSPAGDWSTGIDEAVAAISARQRALDAEPETAPAQGQWRSPEPQHAERNGSRPTQDLSGLERQLRTLTEQIQNLTRPGDVDRAIAELRSDLAEIGRSVTEAAPRRALEALENEIRALAEKIDQSRQIGVDIATIKDMAREMFETRNALHALTPAEGLAGVEEAVRGLAHKIDDLAARPDSGSLQQVETAVSALHGIAAHVASDEALAKLSEEIRGLSSKVERVALAAAERTVSPELETHLRNFGEQLQRQGNTGKQDELQHHIANLSARLDAADQRLGQLDAVEKGLKDLMAHLAEFRAGKNPVPQQSPEPPAVVNNLVRELSRTEDSLEAVQSTVDLVVDRLATIETDIRHRDAIPPSPAETATRVPPKVVNPVPMPSPPAPDTQREAATPAKVAPPVRRPREPIDPNLPPDYPLEPGMGAPRDRKSLSAAERIAESEAALSSGKYPAAASGQTNFIAAARRAAKAAAPTATPEAEPDSATPSRSTTSLGQRVRKFLVGASVFVIVIGGLRIALTMFDPAAILAMATRPATQTTLSEDVPDDDTMASAPPAQLAAPEQPVAADAGTAAPLDLSGDITSSARAPVPAAPAAPATPTPQSPATTGSLPPPAAPSDKLPPPTRNTAPDADAVAAYDTAIRHLEGRGVPMSTAEAARWLERAAKGGIAPAQFRLGSLYEKGEGVKRDIEIARGLYIAAANKGNARAMHNLAVLYAEGVSGRPDLKTAALWFRKAADYGVPDSQYNLAILYARGMGVEQNMSESYKWFALAAAQGDKDAAKKRDDVATRLTPEALMTAKLAAQTFTALKEPDEAINVKAPEPGRERGQATAPAPQPAPAAAPRPKKKAPASAPLKITPT